RNRLHPVLFESDELLELCGRLYRLRRDGLFRAITSRLIFRKPFHVYLVCLALFFLLNQPLAPVIPGWAAFSIHMAKRAIFGAELLCLKEERRISGRLASDKCDGPCHKHYSK